MNQTPQSQGQDKAVATAPQGSMAQPGGGDVLYQGIAKHSSSLKGYLLAVLYTLLGGGLAIVLNLFVLDEKIIWLAALWLAGLPKAVWTYLVHISNKYKISLRRVETEHGVLAKKVDSLELWRVLDVDYSQSLIDRIFDNGKIKLTSTDQSDPELVLHGLPNHRELFEQLRDAVQNARQTNRPMELVSGQEMDGAGEMLGM